MSDLGWRADGIARARACGGVDLDVYRRPGFGGVAVRQVRDPSGPGYGIDVDPPGRDDEDEDRRK